MNELALFIIWSVILAVSYVIFNWINKNKIWFNKIPSWIIVALPFFVLISIALPLTIANVDFGKITLYAASIPTMVAFGFSTPIFLQRFNDWRIRKKENAQKHNISKKKTNKKGGNK
ncbi:hypothetical protein V2E24_01805 [Mycoplasmopsis ciconiae]|uniref:Uncharacterized protein n=1 Tax=Mycoplasmopsis ciconiae TaxID=561067 RepID=A0ABU7MM99_9BACT|nr:hypothetical protein [Mycoplasmopsis ciconiae]